jgi:hypothetical protein
MQLGKSLCILISGKAGVGKDTVAQLLAQSFAEQGLKRPILYKFADKVKTIAYDMGWNGIKDDRGRKLLQDIGRIGRLYDVDTWAKGVVNSAREDWPDYPPDAIIISDWRFPNELDYCNKQGEYAVITIRVEAPDRESLKGTPLYYDESENSLPSGISSLYRYIINNDMPLEDLQKCVDELARRILAKQTVWSE